MPPILVNADRTGRGTFVTDRFEVGDVVGRAVIVHALPDNFANVPLGSMPSDYAPNGPEAIVRTQATGNSGAAIACGVITAANG
jgi:Cu-Zn family superoxide dismutase